MELVSSFWVELSGKQHCVSGSVLMRMFSPFRNALNEDKAASNHEDLLIPANLAPAEEAAVSKVSPPASLEGFCVSRSELLVPPGKQSTPCYVPPITQ